MGTTDDKYYCKALKKRKIKFSKNLKYEKDFLK